MGIFDFFSKKENKEDLDKGLEKTKDSFFSKLAKAIAGKTAAEDFEFLKLCFQICLRTRIFLDFLFLSLP